MRSCDRRKVPANLALCLLSGAFFPILATQPLYADEPSSISEFEECRAIEANARRLLCYDTIADGEVYREEKLQENAEPSDGEK